MQLMKPNVLVSKLITSTTRESKAVKNKTLINTTELLGLSYNCSCKGGTA